ncbi:Ubiquinone/menaquinone biosynthesis C-methylase UbiE [Brevibacterium aurantiacum]|uniref:Ubiquinone/menaquinone biosynthesis C-methylase UbiE n=1 Tax=Brevibacterium aurantiacum TaxID=273384 RepID=A0A2H1IIP3_BREAU|nr:methyltransferase domain-containing protein [Brevibacterium aurantiacum]SMX75087.1 Ubiquinone/menaquinone biosynthesis C-methylase UbiE [Brevibacterium aurantiacum]
MTNLVTAFDKSAPRYDYLTGLNPGYHAHLKRAAAELSAQSISHTDDSQHATDSLERDDQIRIWDLGCGTGSSTRALVGATPTALITGVDKSPGMLRKACKKKWPATVDFQLGAVEDPLTFDELGHGGAPDGVFAAYVFRNIPAEKRDVSLEEVYSALRPGGRIVVHDYSVKGSLIATAIWTIVCWMIIIPLGILSGDTPGLYTYLWRSVLHNDSTDKFTQRLRRAGFKEVSTLKSRGWHRNILHTYTAVKTASKSTTFGACAMISLKEAPWYGRRSSLNSSSSKRR